MAQWNTSAWRCHRTLKLNISSPCKNKCSPLLFSKCIKCGTIFCHCHISQIGNLGIIDDAFFFELSPFVTHPDLNLSPLNYLPISQSYCPSRGLGTSVVFQLLEGSLAKLRFFQIHCLTCYSQYLPEILIQLCFKTSIIFLLFTKPSLDFFIHL